MTSDIFAHHDNFKGYREQDLSRFSQDSRQGTERNSSSLFFSQQNSSDTISKENRGPYADDEENGRGNSDESSERQVFLDNGKVDRSMPRNFERFATPLAATVLRFSYIVLERFLLVLGFAAIATGAVVYAGVFRKRHVFAGLAHFIKGGIFFWYGLLTLGRLMGAFTEYGWAWNVRPRYLLVSRLASRVPSAEFTESFVIWLYGASNVFREHLNSDHWNPLDFQHVSITILFFGGGMLGMLVESMRVRDLLDTTVLEMKHQHETTQTPNPLTTESTPTRGDPWAPPSHPSIPLNPLPALVFLILGLTILHHHQLTTVSNTLHAQWSYLLLAFGLLRLQTITLLYLSPPTSHLPSRPPTELVAAFCLSSAGLVFMGSAPDLVGVVEKTGLGAWAGLTGVLGINGMVMVWEVGVYAVKEWAVRREGRGGWSE